ncbi:hypothetical protein D3C76_1806640 [compost metagenome]
MSVAVWVKRIITVMAGFKAGPAEIKCQGDKVVVKALPPQVVTPVAVFIVYKNIKSI